MALKLADLQRAMRPVQFEYAGETVHLTCRPASPWARVAYSGVAGLGTGAVDLDDLTPAARTARVTAMIAAGTVAMADYIAVIVATVATWDVLDEDGQPVPITAAQISRFPDDFVHALFSKAVWGDSEAPNATAKS